MMSRESEILLAVAIKDAQGHLVHIFKTSAAWRKIAIFDILVVTKGLPVTVEETASAPLFQYI